ncbi:MAG: hypothetical protein WC831_03845 [Parcubacteria group bacterium]|jgi:hypothetical protein
MVHIERPTFLADQAEIENERLADGQQVKVVELSSVSQVTAEKVPNGYVLKQYKWPEFDMSWTDIFEGDDLINPYTHRTAKAYERLKKSGPQEDEPLTKDIIKAVQEQYEKEDSISSSRDNEKFEKEQPDRHAYLLQMREKLQNPEYVAKAVEAWRFPNIAKRLHKRNKGLQQFFSSHGLPDLIVPTNIVVGAERNEIDESRDGPKHLYEIQPRINSLALPESVLNGAYVVYHGANIGMLYFRALSPDQLKKQIEIQSSELSEYLSRSLSLEQLNKIRNEISNLINAAKQLPLEIGKIPYDILMLKNILITKNGLRIIDTNRLIAFPEGDIVDWMQETVVPGDNISDFDLSQTKMACLQNYQRMVDFWEHIKIKIEN